ncbi:MAG: carboxypeptidase regulatory-like domain-containing protein [Isosphaeraceae bacterium]
MLNPPRRARGPRTVRALHRPRHGCRPALQPLESRELLAAASSLSDAFQPTAAEQYMLELVNRARANPPAEGARLVRLAQTDPVLRSVTQGWDLNAFLRQINAYAPVPPLAFNTRLIEAARAHDAAMVATNTQAHSPKGYLYNTQVARASDGQPYFSTAGASSWATGENVYAYSYNVPSADAAGYAEYFAASFLIDWGNPQFGHLKNTLAPGPGGSSNPVHVSYSEVGIGLITGATPTVPPGGGNPLATQYGINVGPALVTEEFAYRAGNAYLTGSFYNDLDANRFYTPGEGLGGVAVTAVGTSGQGVFRAQTWASGGYTLPLPPGSYVVVAAGPGLARPVSTRVTIGMNNVGWSVGLPAVAADLPVPGNFNGSAAGELAVYRASTAQWFVDGQAAPVRLGTPGSDTPVPGDYDGDGRAEPAVFRASTGQWVALTAAGPAEIGVLGAPGDVPVPGDYDGLGRAEPAVYRPSTAQWLVLGPGGVRSLGAFGQAGVDVPVPGDYDGLGRTEPAVYRTTTAEWFVLGPGGSRLVRSFGWAGVDVPVPGDYDGDGRTDLAVYRPTTGEWFLRSPSGTTRVPFGVPGLDTPLRADLDGDGATDLVVFRPGTAGWFARLSGGGTLARTFGQAGVAAPGTTRTPHAAVASVSASARAAPLSVSSSGPTPTPARRAPLHPTPKTATPPPPPPRRTPRWWDALIDSKTRHI